LSARALAGFRVRHRGRIGMPPVGVLRAATRRRLRAPADRDFGSWAEERFGPQAARAVANGVGVVLFDHDPSRLSAEFVWDRFQRVNRPSWPSPRYPLGGWSALVGHMAERARAMGVRIETDARVTDLPKTPVIVATSLASARA